MASPPHLVRWRLFLLAQRKAKKHGGAAEPCVPPTRDGGASQLTEICDTFAEPTSRRLF